jgi:hypothetical protein
VSFRRRSQLFKWFCPVNAKVGDRYVMILKKTAIFCVLRSLLPLALISVCREFRILNAALPEDAACTRTPCFRHRVHEQVWFVKSRLRVSEIWP